MQVSRVSRYLEVNDEHWLVVRQSRACQAFEGFIEHLVDLQGSRCLAKFWSTLDLVKNIWDCKSNALLHVTFDS